LFILNNVSNLGAYLKGEIMRQKSIFFTLQAVVLFGIVSLELLHARQVHYYEEAMELQKPAKDFTCINYLKCPSDSLPVNPNDVETYDTLAFAY